MDVCYALGWNLYISNNCNFKIITSNNVRTSLFDNYYFICYYFITFLRSSYVSANQGSLTTYEIPVHFILWYFYLCFARFISIYIRIYERTNMYEHVYISMRCIQHIDITISIHETSCIDGFCYISFIYNIIYLIKGIKIVRFLRI